MTSKAQMPVCRAGAVKMDMAGVCDHGGPILSPKTQHAAPTRPIVPLFGAHFEHEIGCFVRAGVVQHGKCPAAAFFCGTPRGMPTASHYGGGTARRGRMCTIATHQVGCLGA